jgi:WD40 repeat protein
MARSEIGLVILAALAGCGSRGPIGLRAPDGPDAGAGGGAAPAPPTSSEDASRQPIDASAKGDASASDAVSSSDVGRPPDAVSLPATTQWTACGTMGAALGVLAHSPDGKLLAIGRDDGRVEVLRVSDGVSTMGKTLSSNPIVRLAFSDDGQRLVVLSAGSVRIVALADLSIAREIVTGLRFEFDLQLSAGPEPLLLVVGYPPEGDDVNVKVWRAGDGALVGAFAGGAVAAAAFTDGGASVAVAEQRQGVTIIPLDGSPRRTLPLVADSPTLSRDGTLAAATIDDPRMPGAHVMLMSLKDGRTLWTATLQPHVGFSAGYKPVFLADRLLVLNEGGFDVFGLADGVALGSFATIWATDGVPLVDPAPDGETFALAATSDGRLGRVWTRDGTLRTAPGGWFGVQEVFSLAETRDGRLLAATGFSRSWIIDPRDASLRYMVAAEAAFKPSFSADGSLFALAGDARAVFRVDDGTYLIGIPPTQPSGSQGYPWPGLSISADAKTLASGDYGYVELYGIDGTPKGKLPSQDWSAGIAFSPDGAWMATSGPELRRADTGALVWPSDVPAPATQPADALGTPDNTVAFSPDGALLLVSTSQHDSTGGWQSTTRLLRVADGAVTRDFGATLDRRPSFSADGSWIVAGRNLVHLATDARATLDQPSAASIFLPDGRIVAAAVGARFLRLYCPGAAASP